MLQDMGTDLADTAWLAAADEWYARRLRGQDLRLILDRAPAA
jgi:hypothetical protein